MSAGVSYASFNFLQGAYAQLRADGDFQNFFGLEYSSPISFNPHRGMHHPVAKVVEYETFQTISESFTPGNQHTCELSMTGHLLPWIDMVATLSPITFATAQGGPAAPNVAVDSTNVAMYSNNFMRALCSEFRIGVDGGLEYHRDTSEYWNAMDVLYDPPHNALGQLTGRGDETNRRLWAAHTQNFRAPIRSHLFDFAPITYDIIRTRKAHLRFTIQTRAMSQLLHCRGNVHLAAADANFVQAIPGSLTNVGFVGVELRVSEEELVQVQSLAAMDPEYFPVLFKQCNQSTKSVSAQAAALTVEFPVSMRNTVNQLMLMGRMAQKNNRILAGAGPGANGEDGFEWFDYSGPAYVVGGQVAPAFRSWSLMTGGNQTRFTHTLNDTLLLIYRKYTNSPQVAGGGSMEDMIHVYPMCPAPQSGYFSGGFQMTQEKNIKVEVELWNNAELTNSGWWTLGGTLILIWETWQVGLYVDGAFAPQFAQ